MTRFLLHRTLLMLPVLLAVITLSFFLVRLAPGGPFSQEKAVPPEVLRRMEAHYGLDRPMAEQYLRYLVSIAPKSISLAGLWRCRWDDLRRPEYVGQPVGPGVYLQLDFERLRARREHLATYSLSWDWLGLLGIDLGPSFKHEGRTVNEMIAESWPVSFELGAWAMLLALALGVPAGVLAAVRRNTWLDYLPMSAAMVGICLPTLVVGPLLSLVFGLWLGWLPVSGWFGPADRVLPAITLGLAYAAYIARLSRGGMLEVLSADYIRTARAKGLPEWRVVAVHALRGGLSPVVTFLGPALAGLLSGAFITETIFQIPGLGRHFVNAALSRDYFLVLGTVVLFAALIVVVNLLVDILQVLLNPRLKFE